MKIKRFEKTKKSLLVFAIVFMMALVIGMGAFTYSKYISSYTTEDQTATSAQWGIVISANTSNLFGTDYTLDSGTLATAVSTGNGVAVKASASTGNVVAPGTSGSMTITINGVTEVLARLSISIEDGAKDIFLKIDSSTTYYPIKWTLSDGTITNTSTANGLSMLSGISEEIQAGTTLTDKTYTLSWEWPFESENDDKDSELGHISASFGSVYSEDYASTTISFELSVTVEQILTAS